MNGAIRKALKSRQGPTQEITLRNYETTGEDDYGENWQQTSDSPWTIDAHVERPTQPRADRDAHQVGDTDADARVFIASNHDAVANIRDGGGEGATEIDADGVTYYVLQTDDQHNGQVRLDCERD